MMGAGAGARGRGQGAALRMAGADLGPLGPTSLMVRSGLCGEGCSIQRFTTVTWADSV